jgi:O-antigen/teichoic acid export membrane protein
MSMRNALLLRGSLLRTVVLIANIAVSFFLMPLIVHAVGDRWYGMWTLVGTLIGYYGYFDFGMSVAVQRFVARAIGRGDETEVNRLLTTALVLFTGLAILALLFSTIVALVAPQFLVDAAEIRVFRIVVMILGLNVAVSFIAAPVNGLFAGHMRFDAATTVQLVMLIVRAALIVWFMRAGYSIIALAAITFSVGLADNAARVWYARRLFPGSHVARALYTQDRLRELFAYGGKTFIDQLAELARFHIDHVVIAALISLSAVTIYNIAGTLAYYFRSLIQALVGVLMPMYARQQVDGGGAGLAASLLFTTKLASVVAVLGGGAMFIFGEAFIGLWMGPQYTDAYPSLGVLAVATAAYMTQQPAIALIQGLGRVGTLAMASIVEALAHLVLSLMLVHPLGILGVALGTAIPLLFISAFVVGFSCHLVDIRIMTYIQSVGPVIAVAIAMQIATGFAVAHFAPDTYLDLILLFAAFYPVQALAALWLTFSADEQRTIRTTVARAVGLG